MNDDDRFWRRMQAFCGESYTHRPVTILWLKLTKVEGKVRATQKLELWRLALCKQAAGECLLSLRESSEGTLAGVSEKMCTGSPTTAGLEWTMAH